jgi:predicted CXXCH cytochrome family protein
MGQPDSLKQQIELYQKLGLGSTHETFVFGGPFLFQHPAVEENCLLCHAPHGSSHTKLLNERVPNLCQDCHDWSRHPGTAYSGDQGFNRFSGSPTKPANTRFVARSCLNCHNAIHGSNAPATSGQYLTR